MQERSVHKFDNITIKKISRLALIVSDSLAIILPALMIYTLIDNNYGVVSIRLKTIGSIFLFLLSVLFWSQTLFQQYTIRRAFYNEFRELLHIFLFNGLAVLSVLFVFGLSGERTKHLYFLGCTFVLIPVFRELTRIVLNYFGLWKMQCLVFCPMSELKYSIAAIESQFNLGMSVRKSRFESRQIIKLLNANRHANPLDYEKFKNFIISYYKSIGSPHLIIFCHKKTMEYIPEIVELVTRCGLPYSLIPELGGASLLGMSASHFFRWELLLLTPQNNIERVSYQFIKRAIDLVLGLILIVVLFPIMLIIFCMVKIDGGPGLYYHERIGLLGKKFFCIKFRSMQINSDLLLKNYINDNAVAAKEWRETRKITNDPRVTWIGGYLRKTSLDELPQLFNVILGEMSLVGPRPIVQEEIEKYSQDIDMYYKVRPGITGLWQISGRSKISYEYRVALDMWYIKNWSLLYDFGILLKTVRIVLSKNGAY